MTRDFFSAGRSVVYSTEGMAATSHPIATINALRILESGGTAIDAAVTASAILGVLEPMETGLGGDCFALYSEKGKMPPIAFNGSGRSPKNANLDWFLKNEFKNINPSSVHAITIPGAVDAWWRLHQRFGRLEFGSLLLPAIKCAREGHVVHERVAKEWETAFPRLHEQSSIDCFSNAGRSPKAGEIYRNIQLAKTLESIALNGHSGFYGGEIAEKMVSHLKSLGGFHTLEDFSTIQGEFLNPLSTKYKGYDVYQVPPNSQGIVALLMLLMIEKLDSKGFSIDEPKRIHFNLEAARIAYSLRDKYLGDFEANPRLADILLNRSFIEEMVRKIGPNRSSMINIRSLKRSNTVYLAIVDKDRNVASIANSLFHSFGSGICPPETGVLFQNRGVSFNLEGDHPNHIGPAKRPMHTVMPGMVGLEDKLTLAYGVMGGDYQPLGHAHLLTAILNYGLEIQEACNLPRYMPLEKGSEIEPSFSIQTKEKLSEYGHNVLWSKDPLGGAQVIGIDWKNGILKGASDPRKDGFAAGY